MIEGFCMPTILKIARHSPERCPLNNEAQKKLDSEVTIKLGELCKKYGVKVLGSWLVPNEHLMVMVYDVPTLDTFQKYLMEPLIMKWIASQDTCEFKVAMTLEESMKLLK
jgi:hypothetical protein